MEIKAKITKKLSGDLPTKAFADVFIDDAIVIHRVGIVEKENGRFITMPHLQWTNNQGEKHRRDMCHPISSSARNQIQDAVFEAYDKENQ